MKDREKANKCNNLSRHVPGEKFFRYTMNTVTDIKKDCMHEISMRCYNKKERLENQKYLFENKNMISEMKTWQKIRR